MCNIIIIFNMILYVCPFSFHESFFGFSPINDYCSWFQVEHTSAWNPHTPCMYVKARTETYPRVASGLQHGGHKITT